MVQFRRVADAPVAVGDVITLLEPFAGGEALEPDTPMLSTGIIDSFGVAEVIQLLEDRYGVRIPVEQLGVDTADTPRDLAALIASRS